MASIYQRRSALILFACSSLLGGCGGADSASPQSGASVIANSESTASAEGTGDVAALGDTDASSTDDAKEEALRRARGGSASAQAAAAAAKAATAATTAAATAAAAPATTTTAVAAPSSISGSTTAASATPTATTVVTATSSTAGSTIATAAASATASVRDFIGWAGVYLADFSTANLSAVKSAQGTPLTLAAIDLSAYRTSALPQAVIDQVSASLALARGNGMKVILRPVYNYNATSSYTTAAQVNAHLAQLAPVIAANADVIAYVQSPYSQSSGDA